MVIFKQLLNFSIRYKLLIPYVLLTLVAGSLGTYFVTQQIFVTIEERLDNQLAVAAQTATDTLRQQELERLDLLRQISRSQGLGLAIEQDRSLEYADIAFNVTASESSTTDEVILLNNEGLSIYHLRRKDNGEFAVLNTNGTDYNAWEGVGLALSGQEDDQGNKFVILAFNPSLNEQVFYSLSPVWIDEDVAGVVMVGQRISTMIKELQVATQADITFYHLPDGGVANFTTLRDNRPEIRAILALNATQWAEINRLTAEVFGAFFKDNFTINDVEYTFIFTPLIVRNNLQGYIGAGIVSDFLLDSTQDSRNVVSIGLAILVVLLGVIGWGVTQAIIRPLAKLVATTGVIASGDLSQRTGIESGDEIGHLATAFDQMTESLQNRTEELIEETSKLNAILSSIADGVVVRNKTGEILVTNPAAQNLLSDLPADFLDTVIAELSAHNSPAATVSTTHGPRRFTVNNKAISALSSPVVTAENILLGTVLVLRDITQEFEVERLKNEFIGNISHELRTPLVPINGYLDLLMMTAGSKLDERDTGFVTKIKQNLGDLDRLIFTLIADAELEAGTLGVDEAIFDFDQLVTQAAEAWKPRIIDRELTFEVQIEATDLTILGDERRLKSVIDYLLANASTYIHPGGNITLRVSQNDTYAQLDISDTGVGIAEEHVPQIFTRFFRALHEDFYEERGFGLGLYISKAIISKHQGQIWFNTAYEQGSTFSLSLPLASEDDLAAEDDWDDDDIWTE